MDDFERYGDYNDTEDDVEHKKGIVGVLIKACVFVVCIAVVGILGFRIFLFNTYPSSIKNIYFSDELTAYYGDTGGDIGAKTQTLRAPYDDEEYANFFCDNLIVIEAIGELQISVRYNNAAIANIEKEIGRELYADSKERFSFRLVDNYGMIYSEIAYEGYESQLMYQYIKLVFSGVEFNREKNPPEWIRLEIFVNEAESDTPFAMIPIYENNEDYSAFKDYVLSGEEAP